MTKPGTGNGRGKGWRKGTGRGRAPRQRRSETGRRGPYTVKVNVEAIHRRQVAEWRTRILAAARRRFPSRAFYTGVYHAIGGWRLTVTPRTERAADLLHWPRGEDREYRVQYTIRTGYTFHPLDEDPAR